MRWMCPVLLLGALAALPAPARAQGQFQCGTSDTSNVISVQWLDFSPYRRGLPNQDLSARDIEFQWDPLYGPLTNDARSTLNNYLYSIAQVTGFSPLAPETNTLQGVYDYFRRLGADWNPGDPTDSTSLRVGHGRDEDDLGGNLVSQYTNADRAHVDVYVADPSRYYRPVGGVYPSSAVGPAEDLSTGHSEYDVRHRNSLMATLPANSQFIDLAGTGWTSPYRYRRTTVFAHEFQHSLQQPAAGSPDPDNNSDKPGGDLDEMWSAGAEIVAGTLDSVGVRNEVPYTWPFLSNYQQRTSFMAYVGYNFLNADQNRTLSGMRDDLMYRWSHGDRKLTGLRDRLGDDSCATCAGKTYFHSGGNSLPNSARFALLHHNWRVASFVDNPSLAEGQYGWPSWGGFSPGHTLKAWQDCDGIGSEDLVAIPAMVTVGPRQAARETTFAYQRSFRGGTEPLILQPLGSNYWVIRADPALWNQDRELVVRVSPRGRFLINPSVVCPQCGYTGPLRLMASVVAYNTTDMGEESDLWKKQGNATFTSAVQWVDTDSLSSDIELVVPSFGLTNKAAVLVLSLGDEHGDWVESFEIPGYQAQPYRLDISLRGSDADSQLPSAFSATANCNEDYAAWSPSGDEIVFMATLPQFVDWTQIYRMKLDGSGLTRLAPQVNHQYSPDWSPRGNLIAFEGVTAQGDSRIWMVNLDTPWNGAYDVSNLPGVETMPVFQPNGQGLAYIHIPPFSSTWELRWASHDGTGSRVVATFPGVSDAPRPTWNPSGSRIYLPLNDTLYSVPVAGGSLAPDQKVRIPVEAVDFHVGTGRVLAETTLPVPNMAEYIGDPFMSVHVQAPHRIALVDTNAATRDTSFRYAVRFPAETKHPRYSPDGTRIVYTQTDITGSGDLYVGRITPNHAPSLYPIEDVGEPACVPMLFQISATDPDGDALTYRADYLPSGASIVSGNWFRWQSPAVGEYFVVFRALDGFGGVASQVVRINIFDDGSCYEALAEGGEFGGGAFGGRHADMTRVYCAGTNSTPVANSLLDGTSPDLWAEQVARLMTPVVDEDGTCRATLLARLPGTTTIDKVGLLVVDHPSNASAFPTQNGILVGSTHVATSAMGGDGADLLPQLSGIDAEPLTLPVGATIELALPEGAREGVVLDCARLSKPPAGVESGIDVSTEVGGEWHSIGRLHPRLNRDLLALALDGADRVRLHALTDAEVWTLAGVGSGGLSPNAVTTHVVPPVSAEPAEEPEPLFAADDASIALGNSQTLALAFAPPPTAEGAARSYFITLRARYSLAVVGASRSQAIEPELPTRFALSPGQPNPFGHSTLMRFDVPRRARVLIEAFDVLGRRVRTLTDAEFAPGTHAVAWDGTDDDGATVRPGVYMVRMAAGGFTARHRVVRLAR